MIELYGHNQKAYEAAVLMLRETGKAAVVNPTGTGKSFIAFKLCEDNPQKRICWLSPSEYIFQTQIENLQQAAGGWVPDNVWFCTYARLMLLTDEELAEINPDYIVLDEFHRCGARLWGLGVNRLLAMYEKTPILGLSATAIRYLDNQRDMADELFDGCIASEITLGEAIVRGILNPPKYVTTVFAYQGELAMYKARIRRAKNKAVRDAAEKYFEALRRALDKADGLEKIFARHMTDRTGKYIVFCANIEHMRQMMKKAREWFREVDGEPRMYYVYSDDYAASRSFRDFKNDRNRDHLRLLFCIDALNEGIHLEDISGVILLRPTVSPIVYKQQIGRALSAGSSDNTVIFDVVMNIENLYSIDAVQEEMQRAAERFRLSGEERLIINERFRITDEVRDCREIFRKLNDSLTASWETMYAQAKKYAQVYGNLDVPRRYKTPEGYSLGNWIAIQRKVYCGKQNGVLGPERTERLEAIGMIWQSRAERSWQKYYGAARRYCEEHGDINVPVGYVDDQGVALGKWICGLRTGLRRKSHSEYLTEEHVAMLDALGMVWDASGYKWEVNYEAARRYYAEHGNLEVPLKYIDEDGNRLGLWLNNVRKSYQGKQACYRLTQAQIEKLNAIGMVWEGKHATRWEESFAEAKAYYEAHGDLNVPALYVTDSGCKLGDWLNNQRERYKTGKMPKERIERLEAVGMKWKKPDSWERRFALAEKYYEEHGDLRVPAGYREENVCLNKWLNEQKQVYRGNRPGHSLAPEQIRRLEAIGIDWRGARRTS